MHCDILIAGGGTGGTAAALQAASMGCSVILLDENEWLGGQITSQGLSALDEHRLIDTFGGTALYYEFRNRVRKYYKTHYKLSAIAEKSNLFNPGWSKGQRRIAFEPMVGVKVLNEMLMPFIQSGRLTIIKLAKTVAVIKDGKTIRSVIIKDINTGKKTSIDAVYFIDATELGDLLPLVGIPYSTGEESFSETHEPSASESGNPKACQAFSYSFALEYVPGTKNVIPKPELYDEMNQKHHFSFNGLLTFRSDNKNFSFWEYRQLIDSANFSDSDKANDITLVNCTSTGYREDTLLDKGETEIEGILYRAKQQALSYLYWLQTEAPRDDGGKGFPEVKLRKDLMGTEDGLSQYPYIRESRRIKGVEIIREQDIVDGLQNANRARFWHDTVGIGWYVSVDIQWGCHKMKRTGSGQGLLPFQIPMGAMIPETVTNFIAGAKNIGTTHISNGAYRLHTVEWSIGEAAGVLAAYACCTHQTPLNIYHNKGMLRDYQKELLKNGIPLYWFDDVPYNHKAFQPVQYLALEGIISGSTTDLHFNPEMIIQQVIAARWIHNARLRYGLKKNIIAELNNNYAHCTKAEFASMLYAIVIRERV